MVTELHNRKLGYEFWNGGSSVEAQVKRPESAQVEPAKVKATIQPRFIRELADQVQCWKFCNGILASPLYGLIDNRQLSAEYRRMSDHQYIGFFDPTSNEILGVLRLIPGIAVPTQELLHPALEPFQRGEKKLCDLGLYISSETGENGFAIFRLAYKLAIVHAKLNGAAALFLHSPMRHLPLYQQLGFRAVGEKSTPPGWNSPVVPLLLSL